MQCEQMSPVGSLIDANHIAFDRNIRRLRVSPELSEKTMINLIFIRGPL